MAFGAEARKAPSTSGPLPKADPSRPVSPESTLTCSMLNQSESNTTRKISFFKLVRIIHTGKKKKKKKEQTSSIFFHSSSGLMFDDLRMSSSIFCEDGAA